MINPSFNLLNRGVALHNIRVICPEIAQYLINTYRNSSRLVITGAERNTEILSMEGTTQGDNLAMIFYALGITPIVRALNEVVYRVIGKKPNPLTLLSSMTPVTYYLVKFDVFVVRYSL